MSLPPLVALGHSDIRRLQQLHVSPRTSVAAAPLVLPRVPERKSPLVHVQPYVNVKATPQPSRVWQQQEQTHVSGPCIGLGPNAAERMASRARLVQLRKMQQQIIDRSLAMERQRRHEKQMQRWQRKQAASVKLQATWRGRHARMDVLAERTRREQHAAACTIQQRVQALHERRDAQRARIAEQRAVLHNAASSIQTRWRGAHQEKKELYAGLAAVLADQEQFLTRAVARISSYCERLRQAEREDAAITLQRATRVRRRRKLLALHSSMHGAELQRHDTARTHQQRTRVNQTKETKDAIVADVTEPQAIVDAVVATTEPTADAFQHPLQRIALLGSMAVLAMNRKKTGPAITRIAPRVIKHEIFSVDTQWRTSSETAPMSTEMLASSTERAP